MAASAAAGREEVVVADAPDVVPIGTEVDMAATVRLKVSTGEACG